MKKGKSIIDYLVLGEQRSKQENKPAETIIKRENVTSSIWKLRGKIVVIAEKPKAANKIAYAISKKPYRQKIYGIPYYVINNNPGIEIIVASAAGHLYGLWTNQYGYPVFRYEWKPLYEIDSSARHTEKFIKALAKLCAGADYYINACDYDIEGSVIGYLIIKNHGDTDRSYRAKFSSLTAEELRTAFDNLSSLDWEMIEAGLCRHELDWIWGINISRALMDSVRKASGKRVILSAGRVQTPTLKYVVEKDISRRLFIPIPQYVLSVDISKDNKKIHVEYKAAIIESKKDAQELVDALRKTGYLIVRKYDEKRFYMNPPPAFNLGDLQEEAARIYGYSPYKTQSIAEKLYLDALISYPRTNSQKLPPTLNYRRILEKLGAINNYGVLVNNLLEETKGVLKPVQGIKDDPAHPAIYPTGVIPRSLSKDEWRVYDLIVRRFLATFASKAVIARRSVVLSHPSNVDLVFQASGQQVLEDGWFKYYYFSRPEEKVLPRFSVGEKIPVLRAGVRRTYSKPPEKLTKIKILRWMENSGIGTEATRARIIELLFRRNYLRVVGGKTEATDLGLGIIEVLMQHFPEITSIELTRHFEEEMEKIRRGLKKREDVVREAKNTMIELIVSFDKRKHYIGKLLSYRLGYVSPLEKCIVCNREAYKKGLCRYHYEALKELKEKFDEWRKREEIEWNSYIKTLKRLKSTGKWVQDVLSVLDKIDLAAVEPDR